MPLKKAFCFERTAGRAGLDGVDLVEGVLSDAVTETMDWNQPSKENSMCEGSETGRDWMHLSNR